MIKYLVFVGMIISLIGTTSYIIDMLKGKAKPNRISWLIWGIAPLIATFAALSAKVSIFAIIPTFMSGFGPLVVFIISLFKKEAYWKITKRDIACGVTSILALVLWYLTKDPIIAIILSVLSDLLAGLPTLLKAWQYPETESVWAFIAGILSAATSFAAIEVWDLSSVAFPTYLVIFNICIVFAIQSKRLIKE